MITVDIGSPVLIPLSSWKPGTESMPMTAQLPVIREHQAEKWSLSTLRMRLTRSCCPGTFLESSSCLGLRPLHPMPVSLVVPALSAQSEGMRLNGDTNGSSKVCNRQLKPCVTWVRRGCVSSFYFRVFRGLYHNFGALAKLISEFMLHGYVFKQLSHRWCIASEAQPCSR